MKVLVTGSRDWVNRAAIEEGFDILEPTLVIHGNGKGADWIAAAVAATRNLDIACFPANWNRRGPAAGPYRNRLMYDLMQPDAVLAFPLPQSRGTVDMITYAESQGCGVILVKGRDF